MDANAIPGYTIKKKLGAGAMASVFLARESKLDRDVALKIMAGKFLTDPSFAERFLREARIMASISHRNIVTVFDVGSHGNYHYLAMELLPGGDLTSKLKKGISLRDAISYVMDIAEGLQYAASKNFIHRDIKPDNVMFGEDGRAVITDFGIARSTAAETSMTMVGSIIGTPQYMSPEQASGEKLDHRTDLYSLGIIFYEILTGAPPFKGESAISTGVMHITQPVPDLPPEFEEFQGIIDIALAKNPDDRFQSGHEFIEALSQIDLSYYDSMEGVTQVIAPEDLERSMAHSGRYSGVNSDVNSRVETSWDTYTGSGYAYPAGASRIPYVQRKSRFLPVSLTLILLFLLAGIAGHVFYVNVLGKQIQFSVMTNAISSLSEKVSGKKLNLSPVANSLSVASKGFGNFSGSLIAKVLPPKEDVSGLSLTQQKLVTTMNAAMKDNRLFSPPFDCAELYLKELRALDPKNEIVSKKTSELLGLALDKTAELLYGNDVEGAYKMVTESSRLLPLVKDENLKLKHRQLSSSVMIERQVSQ